MTNQERLNHLKKLDGIVRYHEDNARLERSTAWLHGTSCAKADFHTRMAEKYRLLHTEACQRRGGGSDTRLIAAVAVRAVGFIAGLSVAAVC